MPKAERRGKEVKGLNIVANKLGGLLASCALVVGVASTLAPCVVLFHQPIFPQGMIKFVKKG